MTLKTGVVAIALAIGLNLHPAHGQSDNGDAARPQKASEAKDDVQSSADGKPQVESEIPASAEADEADSAGGRRPSMAQLKADIKLAGEAMNALKSSPGTAVEIAEARLKSTDVLEKRLRARLLWIAGTGCCYVGEFERALVHLETAEKAARKIDDQPLLRRTLRYKAAACLEVGRFSDGSAAAKEGLAISAQMKDQSPYPGLLHNELAGNETRLENYALAITHYEKSIALARKHKNVEMAMMTQHNLAEVLADFGRFTEAAQEYRKVWESAKAAGNLYLAAAAGSSLGAIQLQLKQRGEAEEHIRDALKLSQQHGWPDVEAVAMLASGELHWLQGDEQEGEKRIFEAKALFDQLGDEAAALSAEEKLADLRNAKYEEQIIELERLLAEAEKLNDRRLQIDLNRKLAAANEAVFKFADALSFYRQADALAAKVRLAEDAGELERIRKLAAENSQLRESLAAGELREELKELENQNALKETKLASSRMLANVLGISAVLLLLALLAAFAGYRSRSRLARELQVASEALRDQSEKNLVLQKQEGEEARLESLSLLAAGVAHDFNNLLTAISGSAQFGQISPEADKKDQMLQQVIEVTDQAAGLTKQLVQFLGGKDSQDVSSPGLSLQSSKGVLETLCRKSGIAFDAKLACRHEMVGLGDLQFQQILMNIVTNACEASTTGGQVEVELTRQELSAERLAELAVYQHAEPGDFVCLRVSDNGAGVDEDVKKRMFDPYFSTRRRGRGLGLSSVLGIVQSCKGAIDVRQAQPKGTVVSVYLPIVRSVSVPGRIPMPHLHALNAQKPNAIDSPGDSENGRVSAIVLLVDDDDLTLQTTANLLVANGLQVVTANGAKQAIRILGESSKISCVVTDLSMPQFSGKWLAKQIAVRWPQLPVVLYSGCVDSGVDLQDAKVAHFVQKPFKAEEFIRLLRETIESRGLQSPEMSHSPTV